MWPLYHAIYTQHTCCERINSQAKELGIERPKVHNGRSVANLNTLIYLVINIRARQQAKSINAGLLSTLPGVRYMSYLHPSSVATETISQARSNGKGGSMSTPHHLVLYEAASSALYNCGVHSDLEFFTTAEAHHLHSIAEIRTPFGLICT